MGNNQVNRVLAQDRLEATQDYVRRGRHLEHLDTDALKQHWIAALTSFFHDRSPEPMRGLDDATSELGLRGLSPEALVPPEIWAAMQAESHPRGAKIIKNFVTNPDQQPCARVTPSARV